MCIFLSLLLQSELNNLTARRSRAKRSSPFAPMPRFYGNFKLAFLPRVVVAGHLCCFAVPPLLLLLLPGASVKSSWTGLQKRLREHQRIGSKELGLEKKASCSHQGWCQPTANAEAWPGCALVQGQMVACVSETKVELLSAFLPHAPRPELKHKEEFRI